MLAINIINLGPITITSDALFTFFNLIVLFLFFRFFLFKPVNKILDERQKLIEDEIAEAMEKKKEAEQLKTEYQQKGKVYCYMGVTIGILGVIILI